ncbi:MAG: DUF4124 domain-containing protein [Thiohalomonadales bacterium]
MYSKFISSLIILFLSNSVAAGKIYKWKDANDQMHFSAVPPNQLDVQSTNLDTKQSSQQTNKSDSINSKPNKFVRQYEKLKIDKETKNNKQKYDSYLKDLRKTQRDAKKVQQSKKWKVPQDWRSEAIKKCKSNRGVGCESPDYLKYQRPLSQAERDRLNKERKQRRIREAIRRSDDYCRGGRC